VTESDSTARRLEVAGLAPLIAELSRRFEDGSPVSGVTVRDLDEEQREAIAEAIARKPKGHDFIIDRRASRPAVARHMSVTGG